MPNQTLLRKALWGSLVPGALLCAAVYAWHARTAAFLLGSVAGLLCTALGVWLFFAAWRAAPNKDRVAIRYLQRLAVVFGSTAVALFIPFVDALGVLLPQLLPIPVLAILLLRQDPPEGGSHND